MVSAVHNGSILSENKSRLDHTVRTCNGQLISLANPLMPNGILRRKTYFTRDNWRERVSPAFAAYWSSKKDLELFAGSKEVGFKEKFASLWKRVQDTDQVLSMEIARLPNPVSPRVWEAINAGLDGFETAPKSTRPGMAYAINPESSALFRYIIFLKFGITYRSLITAQDLERDPKALKKLQKAHHDLFRLKSGQLSLSDLKLKFKFDHFVLMVQGLDLGLRKLNPIELSRCLDEICPCNKRHSIERMRKFRTSVKKAVEGLLSDKSKTYKTLN
jgi:hypothetical protein